MHDLCDCLQHILDNAVEALVECDLPVPECRYIAVGRPAVDTCPLLVVWVEQANQPQGRGPCKGPLRWRINLGYWSCWPTISDTGKLPDCDDYAECTCEHLCIVEALIGSFCDGAEQCGQLAGFEVRSRDPEAGCVGTILTATIVR